MVDITCNSYVCIVAPEALCTEMKLCKAVFRRVYMRKQ